jgi:hypothetical protein
MVAKKIYILSGTVYNRHAHSLIKTLTIILVNILKLYVMKITLFKNIFEYKSKLYSFVAYIYILLSKLVLFFIKLLYSKY